MVDETRKEGEGSEKSSQDGKKLRQDDVVGRVVRDPTNVDAKKLVGLFLGNSNREGCWRLYLTAGFDHYVEFRKEDTLDGERFPSGRIVVWVKAGTRVQETRTESMPVEFLQGTIQYRHLPGVMGAGLRQTLAMGSEGCLGPRYDPPSGQWYCGTLSKGPCEPTSARC